jgi:hypothetical protein
VTAPAPPWTNKEQMMGRDAGDPLEARVAECLSVGGEIPADVREWLLDFRLRHEPLGVWDGAVTEEFWLAFFALAVKKFEPEKSSLLAHLGAFFRDTPAYRTWVQKVVLEPSEESWSAETRAELATWPAGRVADARIASLLTTRAQDEPDVSRWVNRFNAIATARAMRFGHPFQDAADLVADFWLWVYAVEPARVFSRYTPSRAPLFNFAFRCFDHEFRDWGEALDDERATLVGDSVLDRTASPAPPLDELDPEDFEVARPRWSQEVSRRVRACLGRLGMGIGQPGWLMWQVHIGRSYRSLSQELSAGEGGMRERTELALRQRVFQAKRRFNRLWVAQAGDTMLPRLPGGSETVKRSFHMTDEDAVRLVQALDEQASHPSDDDLINSAYGELAAADGSRVDAHLGVCAECRDHVSLLRDTLAFFQTPAGKERLGRLWTSFREAAARVGADRQDGQTSGFAAAAARTHDQYARAARSALSWADLPDDFKRSNYHQLAYAEHILETAGLGLRPLSDREDRVEDIEQAIGPEGLRRLAELEHERFVAERMLQGWRFGSVKDPAKKISPYLVGWDGLSPDIQELDVKAVMAWPATFREVGLEVHRVSR